MLSVLIVEDNVLLADILEDYLAFGGYQICGVASTASEAVALANWHQPDLAVVDYRLAEGTYGSQIRPLLKDGHRMGILYATADLLHSTLSRRDGEAFIRKPFVMEELLQSLRIVQELKKDQDVSYLPVPRNFYELGYPPNHQGAA